MLILWLFGVVGFFGICNVVYWVLILVLVCVLVSV